MKDYEEMSLLELNRKLIVEEIHEAYINFLIGSRGLSHDFSEPMHSIPAIGNMQKRRNDSA